MGTLFNTVRYLKPVQIYSRLPWPRPAAPTSEAPPVRATQGTWRRSILHEGAQVSATCFRFLNEEREVRGWNDADVPKLWRYHLHYFDCCDGDLIQRWIRENPVGEGIGWEPYPLSRRIVNWIKWAYAGHGLPAEAIEGLATQTRYLSRRLEYHLLANHLFANAKALVFAGSFFAGTEADDWRIAGLRILEREIPEQILEDGGHFERSPMYHGILLEDVLDLVNLGRTYPDLLPDWSETAARMLAWQKQMIHPDGDISFFNDATLGVAPIFAELRDYADRLGVKGGTGARLSDSGYIRLENEDTVLIFDAGRIGPDYQPGHAHADTLSFELAHQGKRVVVNSGTSTYEVGAERQRQRGTADHNTVRIDGIDQSEVWASFRVARRAYPFDVRTDHQSFAEAAHDGYRRLRNPVVHRRRVELSGDGVAVTDMVEGTGEHEVEVFFHLDPGADQDIELDPRLGKSREETTYHPGFNLSIPNTTIVGRFKGATPVVFRSLIPL